MQWEYTVWQLERSKDALDENELMNMLNWYGQQGWELITCNNFHKDGYTRNISYVFKRPVVPAQT